MCERPRQTPPLHHPYATPTPPPTPPLHNACATRSQALRGGSRAAEGETGHEPPVNMHRHVGRSGRSCNGVPPPATRNHAPSTLHPTPSTLHPNPATRNPQPATLHPNPSTRHPNPYKLHPKPEPYTPNPKPSTLNCALLSGKIDPDMAHDERALSRPATALFPRKRAIHHP